MDYIEDDEQDSFVFGNYAFASSTVLFLVCISYICTYSTLHVSCFGIHCLCTPSLYTLSSLTTFFRSFHLSIFCSIPAIVFGSSFRSLLWFTALRQFQTVQSHAGYNLPWCVCACVRVCVCACVCVCVCVCGALVNVFAFFFCRRCSPMFFSSFSVFLFFFYCFFFYFSLFFFLFLHRYIDPCNLFDGA